MALFVKFKNQETNKTEHLGLHVTNTGKEYIVSDSTRQAIKNILPFVTEIYADCDEMDAIRELFPMLVPHQRRGFKAYGDIAKLLIGNL